VFAARFAAASAADAFEAASAAAVFAAAASSFALLMPVSKAPTRFFILKNYP
jgi:hypothetical protein